MVGCPSGRLQVGACVIQLEEKGRLGSKNFHPPRGEQPKTKVLARSVYIPEPLCQAPGLTSSNPNDCRGHITIPKRTKLVTEESQGQCCDVLDEAATGTSYQNANSSLVAQLQNQLPANALGKALEDGSRA